MKDDIRNDITIQLDVTTPTRLPWRVCVCLCVCVCGCLSVCLSVSVVSVFLFLFRRNVVESRTKPKGCQYTRACMCVLLEKYTVLWCCVWPGAPILAVTSGLWPYSYLKKVIIRDVFVSGPTLKTPALNPPTQKTNPYTLNLSFISQLLFRHLEPKTQPTPLQCLAVEWYTNEFTLRSHQTRKRSLPLYPYRRAPLLGQR